MIRKTLMLLLIAGSASFFPDRLLAQSVSTNECAVTIKFIHIANGKKILKNDSTYRAPDGVPYTISKLKYYCSDFDYNKDQTFLIDAFGNDSASLSFPPGEYKKISFLLGVDSLHNSSGAQEGTLDPLNDMFWTWNSGYVMFKLEGNSDSSTADMKRIEHHIGGYKGIYKTMRMITIKTDHAISLSTNKRVTILIQMDLDKYWKGINSTSISSTPVIVTPGALAKASADNFPGMFHFKEAIYK